MAIASTALVGVEARKNTTRHRNNRKRRCRRCGLLQNRATRATQTRREALRTLADAFPGGETVLGATVGAGCVAHVRRGLRHGRAVAVKLVHPAKRCVEIKISGAPRHRRDVLSVAASARWRGDSTPSTRRCPRGT